MQYIHHIGESHRINGTKSIAAMILNNLKYSAAFAFPELDSRMLCPELRQSKGITHLMLHIHRESQVVLLRRGYPMQRLAKSAARRSSKHTQNIPRLEYFVKDNSSND